MAMTSNSAGVSFASTNLSSKQLIRTHLLVNEFGGGLAIWLLELCVVPPVVERHLAHLIVHAVFCYLRVGRLRACERTWNMAAVVFKMYVSKSEY